MQDGPNDDENPNATLPKPDIFSNMAAWGHASISEYDTENDEMMRALCIEAEGLLGLAQEVMEKTSRIRNELQGCIEAWSMPVREGVRVWQGCVRVLIIIWSTLHRSGCVRNHRECIVGCKKSCGM